MLFKICFLFVDADNQRTEDGAEHHRKTFSSVDDADASSVAHHKRRHDHRMRSISTTKSKQEKDCSKLSDAVDDSSTICNRPEGGICRNRTCVSSCSIRHLQKCICPLEDDNYCYLCCGDDRHSCLPAHKYQIYQPNGEHWERDTCTRCRNYYHNGLSCDDRDRRRVCYNGKCISTLCQGQDEGTYCDIRKYKICTDGDCRDPCREYKSSLLTCECDVWSDDRCQLCCFDPSTKKCESAFRKYGIKNRDQRAIYRHGLECRRGQLCNKFGTCSGAMIVVSTTKLGLILIVGIILKFLLSLWLDAVH